MRRTGRNFESRIQNQIDEYSLVAQAGDVKWHIYDGPIGNDENAHGWVSSIWAATCIPYSLYRSLFDLPEEERHQKIRENIRLLRVNNTLIKYLPTPDTHVILAPPPSARPSEGVLEEIPVSQREHKGAVQKGSPEETPPTTIAEKVRAVKRDLKDTNLDEILYPDQGDVWFGTMRQGESDVELYTKIDPVPLISAHRESLAINTGTTKFAHDPKDMKYKNKEGSPLIEVLPSTSAVPVDAYIPYLGEIVAIMSIVKSIASFFEKHGDKSYTDFVSRTDRITEVIDYQTMRNWYSYEEGQ